MRRRTEPTPADPGTLAGWWRIGLVLGITAVAGMLTGAVLTVVDGAPGAGPATVLVLGGSTLLALAAAVFLRRTWSEPLHRDGPWSRSGRGVTALVGATWSLAVLLNAPHAVEVPVPELVRSLTAGGFVGSVLGMLVVAVRDRPARW